VSVCIFFKSWKINPPLQYRKPYFQPHRRHETCSLRRKICPRKIKVNCCLLYKSMKDLHTLCGQNAEIFFVKTVTHITTTGLFRENNLPVTWLHVNITTQTDIECSRFNSALPKLPYAILSVEQLLNLLQNPEIRLYIPPKNMWFLKDPSNRGCIIKQHYCTP
jgi:hypothetical protein